MLFVALALTSVKVSTKRLKTAVPVESVMFPFPNLLSITVAFAFVMTISCAGVTPVAYWIVLPIN